jgi:hypothetical protein
MIKLLFLLFSIAIGSAVHAQLTPFYSKANDKYGYKDAAGKDAVPPIYDLAYPFTEGMAAVRVAGKYGYLNETGKVVVEPKYDFTWRYIGGYSTVRSGNKYGLIDKTGKVVVPLKYDDANNYHGNCCYKGMAHVRENGKWKIIKIPN